MESLNKTGGQEAANRRPACHACKTRKTKCDRTIPCSSCVAAKLQCLTTRKTAEKRQRVLLSSKYDGAMEDVRDQLHDIAENVKTLLLNEKARSQGLHSPVPPRFPSSADRNSAPFNNNPEEYTGDSSFNAHVVSVVQVLETTNATSRESPPVQQLLLDLRETEKAKVQIEEPCSSETTRYFELEDLPLPPITQILKLLRLIDTEGNRFFVDIPIIDEHEFIKECQKVYFPVEPLSQLTWIVVNVGLLYSLIGLDSQGHTKIGMTIEELLATTKQLSANINEAIRSLKLCLEPSLLLCQALGLLAMFCIKTGQTSIAWRLMTAASRTCLDLGLHRLSTSTKDSALAKKQMLFWWMYAMEKGLAFTFGRTPTIHQYDVTTSRPIFPQDWPRLPRIYYGYLEFAVITGDIHQTLFSASSHRQPRDLLIERAKEFASELKAIQDSLKPEPGDVSLEAVFKHAAIALEVITYSLLAVVYRIVPASNRDGHPLQCRDECIDASRKALKILVQIGQQMLEESPEGWKMLLNLIISLVPFVAFLVLIGSTIAIRSDTDMDLLASCLAVVQPVADDSPAAHNLFKTCRQLYRIAEIFVSSRLQVAPRASPGDIGYNPSTPDETDSRLPMLQLDWDEVMKSFEAGLDDLDAREMAMFIEPYM